jgi:hypothetical protein
MSAAAWMAKSGTQCVMLRPRTSATRMAERATCRSVVFGRPRHPTCVCCARMLSNGPASRCTALRVPSALRRAHVPATDAGPRAQGRVPPLRQARRQGRRRPHPAQQAGARLQGRVQPRAPGAARPLSGRGPNVSRPRAGSRVPALPGSTVQQPRRPRRASLLCKWRQQAPSCVHPHGASLPCTRRTTASALSRQRRQTPAQPPPLVR